MMYTNRFRVFFAFVVAVAASGVSAQSFDQCGNNCLNTSFAASSCKSVNDTSCVCTNAKFQTTFAACLQNCSSEDQTVAQTLEAETCSNVSTSNSTSSTVSSSATKLATSAASASTAASTTPASSGATVVEQLPLLSVAIVVAGVMMGGAFAL